MDEPESRQDLRWLLEPPGANEVQFHLSVGEGVEVTEEVQAALERLLNGFQTEDVEGYGTCWPKCGSLKDCKGVFQCSSLNNCTHLWSEPCRANVSCKITKIV